MCSNSQGNMAEVECGTLLKIQNFTQAYARSSRRRDFLCLFTQIYLSNLAPAIKQNEYEF